LLFWEFGMEVIGNKNIILMASEFLNLFVSFYFFIIFEFFFLNVHFLNVIFLIYRYTGINKQLHDRMNYAL
jgi:histidyl-tRNA synthetase